VTSKKPCLVEQWSRGINSSHDKETPIAQDSGEARASNPSGEERGLVSLHRLVETVLDIIMYECQYVPRNPERV
jgi:hypothetical protein